MTDFLSICSDKRRARCEKALETLQSTPLYNVDYKEAKYQLDNAVEGAWYEKVQTPFLNGRGFDTAEYDFDTYLGSVNNLNDVIARRKKLSKLKPTTKLQRYSTRSFAAVDPAMVKAVTEILEAAHPVALMVKQLKASVVKGRRPSKLSKAAQAEQAKQAAKRTCPCCFRPMVVKPTITRHGWTEAGGRRVGQYGNTWHQGSCFGVGYAAFEVSSQGTIDFLTKAVAPAEQRAAEYLAKLQARPATITVVYTVGWGRNEKVETVELADDGMALDDPEAAYSYTVDNVPDKYAYELNRKIASAKYELKSLREHKAFLEAKIVDWKPAK
jgi:hypothetical protein